MIKQIRADEIIPGDLFDTRCGVGGFVEITAVRILENDAPGQSDRVELRWVDGSISPTRTLLAGYLVSVKA